MVKPFFMLLSSGGMAMEEVARFTKFVKSYKKSEIIIEENTPGDEMYVIHSGRVKLSRKASGREAG